MKKFLTIISLIIAIPLILLVGIYVWTDPFRCIHDFDINDVDATNREYLSTELFLRNNSTYHYNSFIFSSSRGCGMNTYQWKQYLQDGVQPFLFQAWSETLTGNELKLEYLDEHEVPIDNALLLFDVPGTFAQEQLPFTALSMKHFLFTGGSRLTYNVKQFICFVQRPSLWVQSIETSISHKRVLCESDTITNDWIRENQFKYIELPPQDSLKNCSDMTRKTFMAKWEHSDNKVEVSEPLINSIFETQLRHIKHILDVNQTDYHIIITPAPCYTNPAINPNDLEILQNIFGAERVHNYSGKNAMTEDYNNFSDPTHFGLRVGHMIIEDIYKISKEQKE